MTKWLLIFVGAVILAAGAYHGASLWNAKNQQEMSIASEADAKKLESAGVPLNCKDKEKCIVVYIAPWCGVCVSSEPTFHAFHKYLPKLRPQIGFGLIVAAGSPNENAAKKNELLPIETYVDDSRNLLRARNIDRFPTWVVVDPQGNELSRMSGGFQVTAESSVEQALQEVLKL